ncbi:regulator of G-protein signaling 1 isoform X2 [Denticeps clupeoides]|uniref:RGS domain-containing protein n=1 Tax=Denticeps clupeoides TaxID=299321 RepID=A0AAY4DKD8_9TELE|nr:regulator of G-protein signaling 1-like isoform X2 [Denticeps clupeoides]
MRRFSSEGSLQGLDMTWRKVDLNNGECSGSYTSVQGMDEVDGCGTPRPPTIVEPDGLCRVGKGELTREMSMSVENINQLEKSNYLNLRKPSLSESCRAYSDSQLVPGTDADAAGTRAASTPHHFSSSSLQAHHARARLAAAKLHLKSLFSLSPHSSHSNLVTTEQKTSASNVKEQRSRVPFLRQWSQVGHGRSRISREELHAWATSLNRLLDSRAGVAVFGAFLRSEFSEENLQFYLACEQYQQSSHNFSLHRRARDICDTYIKPGAPREVNLDSKTREVTLQRLQAPSHASLEHAQKRIYYLLDTDCYPRFLQSSMYQSLLENAH